ncbi:MAG TPA: glycosyltransferase family 2 protein [Candidatus Acidoferrales bacterium]|nr:glycosyltransferase family 2 protein [Candidatus Acidoferrales bacterium]
MSASRINPESAAGMAPPSQKLLSICVPTFNRASYLRETLESLLPQLGPDVELLVYDTGSTDGTPQLIEVFKRRCPSLRSFYLPDRRGFDEALLLLLGEARGEYVWYFGSDDVLNAGAIDAIRRRILASPARPSLVFLNHEIVDNEGRLLIPSNLGRTQDCEFTDGRASVPWLALHLGYISACIFRRDPALSLERAREFEGSMWMGVHLNLWSISRGGPALYVGRPMIRARRNPGNIYNYGEIFCRNASRVFWDARRSGIPWLTIYRAMNRTVRLFYLRFSVSRRCDASAEFDRAFPAMLRTCWPYPWFWLLVVPVRLSPSWLVRAVRRRLRDRRERRNADLASRGLRARQSPARQG